MNALTHSQSTQWWIRFLVEAVSHISSDRFRVDKRQIILQIRLDTHLGECTDCTDPPPPPSALYNVQSFGRFFSVWVTEDQFQMYCFISAEDDLGDHQRSIGDGWLLVGWCVSRREGRQRKEKSLHALKWLWSTIDFHGKLLNTPPEATSWSSTKSADWASFLAQSTAMKARESRMMWP